MRSVALGVLALLTVPTYFQVTELGHASDADARASSVRLISSQSPLLSAGVHAFRVLDGATPRVELLSKANRCLATATVHEGSSPNEPTRVFVRAANASLVGIATYAPGASSPTHWQWGPQTRAVSERECLAACVSCDATGDLFNCMACQGCRDRSSSETDEHNSMANEGARECPEELLGLDRQLEGSPAGGIASWRDR